MSIHIYLRIYRSASPIGEVETPDDSPIRDDSLYVSIYMSIPYIYGSIDPLLLMCRLFRLLLRLSHLVGDACRANSSMTPVTPRKGESSRIMFLCGTRTSRSKSLHKTI